jgi:hypothetical protein
VILASSLGAAAAVVTTFIALFVPAVMSFASEPAQALHRA